MTTDPEPADLHVHPGETDLLMPLAAAGEVLDPHLIHTHYFGFSVPEVAIGGFIYIRYQPAFPLSQGGVCIFQGNDNLEYNDMAYLDYEITMPWPTIENDTITTDNGLVCEFVEPGRTVHLTYTGRDGRAAFDLVAEALTPLLARGHVMPGEEAYHDMARKPGGSEQFVRVTGQLQLDGSSYQVDCFAVRDRSWRQVRVERKGAVSSPPVGWSPMYFDEDLIFNQISFEPLDTNPRWSGLYDVGGRASHHFAWVQRSDGIRAITSVRRNVLEYHPRLHMATRQEITAQDAHGETYRFHGRAIASAPIPAWPNATLRDSVYRWEDDQGRTTHSTFQEVWFDDYQRSMSRRA